MIRVSNLRKTYDSHTRNAHTVLQDVSLTLPDTGFVCILGASGCGKTSLLNAIGGLDNFQKGIVDADGVEIRPGKHRKADRLRSSQFGYIFQNYYLLPEHTVQYNVYLGLHGVDLTHQEKMRRVNQALRRVDMLRFAKRKVADLSGGQQQRVAIARALAPSPKVIFADEPTGNLDETNTMNICALLRNISKDALVVMVTHERRLAHFFADRIITLKNGSIETDTTDWERQPLEFGDQLYTGDYQDVSTQSDGFTLELYRDASATPVQLTVVALSDRIIIKTNDNRRLLCSEETSEPILRRGKRPVVTLNDLEQQSEPAMPRPEAGSGKLSFSMKCREALLLLREKGLYRTGMLLFLAALTILTCYVYSDWKTISSIDPRDFITSDSHVLEVVLDRGPHMPDTKYVPDYCDPFLAYLHEAGMDFEFLPTVSSTAACQTDLVLQLSQLSAPLGGSSFIPLEKLPTDSLIAGRMPERSEEIVVDRWVLDNFLKKDGLLQNSIPGISYFLEKPLYFSKKSFTPTVVGICDSGQCAIYLTETAMVSLGVGGQEVLSLSELQQLFPGTHDDITLDDHSCIMVTNNAGETYRNQIGGVFRTKSGIVFDIADAFPVDTYAALIVSDNSIHTLQQKMTTAKMLLYCQDRDAVCALLRQPLPKGLLDEIQVQVNDLYGNALRSYQAATKIRADARTIVTLTAVMLSLVMLYLLRRSQLQKRIGMMAVYRLLGIPGRDLLAVYSMEAAMVCGISALPVAALTYSAFSVARSLPSLEFSMLFAPEDAALIFAGVFLFYQFITLLPTLRILRKPPAQIAQRIN